MLTVEKRAPSKIQIQHPMTRIPTPLANTIVRSNTQHLPDFPLFDKIANLYTQREIPRPHSLHQKQALLLCNLNEDFGLCGIDCKRFLAEDILPILQRQARVLVVVRMRSGNIDNVNVFVGHQLVIRSVSGRVSGDVDVGNEFLRAGLG